jgi:hypothetical protein
MNVEGRKEALIKSTLDLIEFTQGVRDSAMKDLASGTVDFICMLTQITSLETNRRKKVDTFNTFIDSLFRLLCNGIPYNDAMNIVIQGQDLVDIIPKKDRKDFLRMLALINNASQLLISYTGKQRCVD